MLDLDSSQVLSSIEISDLVLSSCQGLSCVHGLSSLSITAKLLGQYDG